MLRDVGRHGLVAMKVLAALGIVVAIAGCPSGAFPGVTVDVTHDVEYARGVCRGRDEGWLSLAPLLMDVYRGDNATGGAAGRHYHARWRIYRRQPG